MKKMKKDDKSALFMLVLLGIVPYISIRKLREANALFTNIDYYSPKYSGYCWSIGPFGKRVKNSA